ncbi:MAG: MFS transporter [Bryobacterales bacterium]
MALLSVSVGVNYIDRGLLSVSAPLIVKDLGLTPAEMGLLFSAFFWSYAGFQVIAGWLVDRWEVKWVYAGGYLLWSLATAATGLVNRFGSLLGARLALGLGESVSYPACSKVIVGAFEEDRRGVANAVIDVAAKIGPGLSMLSGGLLLAHFGWRSLFLAVGLASLLWLFPWLRLAPAKLDESAPDKTAGSPQHPQPSIADLLRRAELWGTSLGLFSLGYVWYFLLSWLPTYLIEERGFSMERMAVLGSLPFWVMAVGSLCGGWLADFWIARGGSPTLVRKTFVIAGLAACAVTIGPVAAVSTAGAPLRSSPPPALRSASTRRTSGRSPKRWLGRQPPANGPAYRTRSAT